MDDTLRDIKELSFEDLRRVVEDSLNPRTDIADVGPRPPYRWIQATYPDRVIIQVEGPNGGRRGVRYYQIPYTVGTDNAVTLGEPVEVEQVFQPVGGEANTAASDAGTKASTAPPKKTEGDTQYSAADYAVVPDPEKPSTWKLRLAEEPGKVTVAQLGRAAAALSAGGFRGNQVDLTDAERAAAKKLIRAEYAKLKVAEDDMPESVKEAADKAGQRVQGSMRDRCKAAYAAMQKALGDFKDFLAWADYDEGAPNDAGQAAKQAADGPLSLGFKLVAPQSPGQPWRWVGVSATAFQDSEGEIFQTKALADMEARHDTAKADLGPLLLWHIPGSAIGSTKGQSVVGRMLVEWGELGSDELGQKAQAYLAAHPNVALGMSVGYQYRAKDREDGVYDWVEVVERSVLPPAAAASPFTHFNAKEATVNDAKKTFLKEWLGADLAEKVIAGAEARSKELEQTVGFKEAGEKTADAEDTKGEGVKMDNSPSGNPIVLDEKALSALVDALTASPALVALGQSTKASAEAITALKGVVDALAPLAETVKALENRLAAVEKADAEKVKSALDALPRVVLHRASQDAATVVDGKGADAALVKSAVGKPSKGLRIEDAPGHPFNNPIIHR